MKDKFKPCRSGNEGVILLHPLNLLLLVVSSMKQPDVVVTMLFEDGGELGVERRDVGSDEGFCQEFGWLPGDFGKGLVGGRWIESGPLSKGLGVGRLVWVRHNLSLSRSLDRSLDRTLRLYLELKLG